MIAKLFDFALVPRAEAETLYFRSEGFIANKGNLYAKCINAKISFDTYFNLVPITTLKKHCDVSSVIFDICAEGEYLAEVITFEGETEEIISCGKSPLKIVMSDISDSSLYLYLRITALSNSVSINKISAYVDSVIYRNITPAIVICTYHREKYATRNALSLAQSIDADDVQGQIIVVDNGRTLSSINNSRIILIPNDNTGGSGGFAKGMEFAAKGNFTHIIIMDDDVTFEYISFQKLFGFLQTAKDENLCISGTMLFEDKPSICFESGGFFNIVDGSQKGFCYGLDMTEPKCLAENERDKQLNYGGWWLMCMPIKYVESGFYPLPFFVKYDDVEYSLRCKMNIITIAGVSVWHNNFESKYNSDTEYYNMRNYLLLRKLHGGLTAKQARKIAQKRLYEKLCRQQYKMAQAVVLGYRDFLKGIGYLNALNPAENHQKIRGLNYQLHDEKQLEMLYGVKFTEDKLKRSEQVRFKRYMQPLFYGQLVPNLFCRKNPAVTDVFFDRKEMYFRYRKALHFDMQKHCGYVTEKNFKNFLCTVINFKRRKYEL